MPSLNEETPPDSDSRSDRGVAIAIALSILICLVAFVWIFVELEPFMSDFTGTDAVVSPEADDPFATPVDASPTP